MRDDVLVQEQIMLSLRHAFAIVLTTAATATSVACAPSRPPAEPGSLAYTEAAHQLYDEGMRAFYEHDWEVATKKFNEVRDDYSQSPYARLAELRIADIAFEKDSLADAISGYKDFAKAHREDPGVPYARFRMCQALVAQINVTPLLPPQEERDQDSVQEAYQALMKFKRAYPHTKWDRQVDYMIEDISGRLARHELYVARFYLKMDRFDATVARLKTALQRYPNSGLAPEALLMLGETYLKQKKKDMAREVFRQSVRRYPGSPFSKLAQDYLDRLGPRTIAKDLP